jgi:formylglycine-generating enzyme required for sulfatase activity
MQPVILFSDSGDTRYMLCPTCTSPVEEGNNVCTFCNTLLNGTELGISSTDIDEVYPALLNVQNPTEKKTLVTESAPAAVRPNGTKSIGLITEDGEVIRQPRRVVDPLASLTKGASRGSMKSSSILDVEDVEYAPTTRINKKIFIVGTLALVVIVSLASGIFWILNRKGDEKATTISVDKTGKPVAPENMVYIPGGTFLMGDKDGDEYESPSHIVSVAPFFIDKYEVTCEQYQKFINETGHKTPKGWTDGKFPEGAAKLPVTGVNWNDATAYALWAGKRLPTEQEWEFAARGTDGRIYPWGHSWEPNISNIAESGMDGVTEVGSFAKGVSPFGLFDTVGNAWEWTSTEIHSYPNGKIPEDDLPEAERKKLKVIRGGCYLSNKHQATAIYRMAWAAEGAEYPQTGFRCAKDVK